MMKREIKFRAWDNVENKMIYVGEDSDYAFEVTSTGIRCTKLGTNPFDYEILEHLNYQQYTGLKDKNGKEIYEGDIVDKSYTNPMNRKNVKQHYVIEWKNGIYRMKFIKDKPEFDRFLWMHYQLVEVIGNIYENPELLEEKHE